MKFSIRKNKIERRGQKVVKRKGVRTLDGREIEAL